MNKKATMDKPEHMKTRECAVVVRKLSLEEISRITISPFFISNKCGLCQKITYYGPKCTTCSESYHYDCANRRGMCCELPILFHDKRPSQFCPKCSKVVDFGPSCTICSLKFHNSCLGPFDHCCNVVLCRVIRRRPCGSCRLQVDFGPRCPFCAKTFHPQCVEKSFTCCNNKIGFNDNAKYKCKCCRSNVLSGCAMCLSCGQTYHIRCLTRLKGGKKCCGNPVSLEISFIPSYKYLVSYFKQFNNNRQAQLQKVKDAVRVMNHNRILRGMIKETDTQERDISCQTSALDQIQISDVKTKLEEIEVDIVDISSSPAPPLLQREMTTPQPSPSSQKLDSSVEGGDDSLKNLFEFLYNMVKKFPPQLQTQVKVDLFKIVTEAEMKLQCDREEVGNSLDLAYSRI